MERRMHRPWAWRGRLLMAASLPTVLALVAVLGLHVASEAQGQRELQARAALIAAALAEASEYGLVSGNPAAVDRSVRELLAHDGAIASIDILDAARRPFVSLAGSQRLDGGPAVERPVRSSVPDIDFFDRPTPHVSLVDAAPPSFRPGPVLGYVRIAMSVASARAAQRQRLALQLGIVAAAGLAGLLLVAHLAGRAGAQILQEALPGPTKPPPSVAPSEPPPSPSPEPASSHRRNARRIVGRLDAAAIALRLSAGHAARLAELSGSDVGRQQAHEVALRVLAVADHLNAAGPALFEPLRAQVVAELGLPAALEDLLGACALAHPECSFTLRGGRLLGRLEGHRAGAVHRFLHDALALVVACADATEVEVSVEVPPKLPPTLRIVVRDNGPGEQSCMSSAQAARLDEQLAAIGAEIDRQQSAAGSVLAITLPVPAG
jgi:hypothetical protein